jgi:membrane protein YdbS with pleckstrin-like domain
MRLVQLAVVAVPCGLCATGLGFAAAAPLAPVALLLAAAIAALAYRFLLARYRAWGYRERDDDLLVKRGCLLRRVSVVPYGRMQFVDVTSGPFERSFQLATVRLHTAAAATDARIPGLDEAEAARLRDRLAALGEARLAGL